MIIIIKRKGSKRIFDKPKGESFNQTFKVEFKYYKLRKLNCYK